MTLTAQGCDGHAGGTGVVRTDPETQAALCGFPGSVGDWNW